MDARAGSLWGGMAATAEPREQGLGQTFQHQGQQVRQLVPHVPEQYSQFGADRQIMTVWGMFATAE